MNPTFTAQIGDQAFDYTDPWAHEPNLNDAVAAISKLCRFNGHTKEFYSVAQHCVFVSVLAERAGGAWSGLAHDLAEAFYGDFPSPLKALIRESAPTLMARINTIDSMVEAAFGFDPNIESVKKADLTALVTERRDLMGKAIDPDLVDAWKPFEHIVPSDYILTPLPPAAAEKAWWRRYYQLFDQGKAPKFPGIPSRGWCGIDICRS